MTPLNRMLAKRGAAVVLALLASLGVWEGRKLTPYYDQAGVLTVCEGITTDVQPRDYSPAECDELRAAAVYVHATGVEDCLPGVKLADHEWQAYTHFAYNVGVRAFCGSTARRLLLAGDRKGACRQMARWTVVRIQGVPRDCREAQWGCGGIPKRRDYEVGVCLGEIKMGAIT